MKVATPIRPAVPNISDKNASRSPLTGYAVAYPAAPDDFHDYW